MNLVEVYIVETDQQVRGQGIILCVAGWFISTLKGEIVEEKKAIFKK